MTLLDILVKLIEESANIIIEMAAELEAEVVNRYDRDGSGVHPALRHRYDRDMEPVLRGRAHAERLREIARAIERGEL